jgi:hypothetical protein
MSGALEMCGTGAICFRNRVRGPSERNSTSYSAEEPLTATTAVIPTGTENVVKPQSLLQH